MEIPTEGAYAHLMWSDPEETIKDWQISPRGAGYMFGFNVVKKFNHINGLDFIVRAHQLIMEGYKHMFNEMLVTIWSAPNYCYRYSL
jgi:diadenosine tetraphosphatase ApaH/serine/threonine PP2A family protein phosphatase